MSAPSGLGACDGPSVATQGVLPAEWFKAVQGVRARMRENADLDRCAELHLEAREDGLQVRVVTSKGRAAIRVLTEPEKLLRTVEALTEVPPTLSPAPPSPDPHERPDDEVDGSQAAPTPPAPTAHIEMGAGAAGRLAGGPLYGGGGVATFAQLAFEHWVMGVNARWEAVDDTLAVPSPSGFNMQTFEVGIGLGRRAQLGSVNFDAVLGPEVVVESQEANGYADEFGGTASGVRLDFLIRLSVPRTGRARFFAAADADVSPSRLRRPKQLNPGLPVLPAWSSGLQIGFLWGPQ